MSVLFPKDIYFEERCTGTYRRRGRRVRGGTKYKGYSHRRQVSCKMERKDHSLLSEIQRGSLSRGRQTRNLLSLLG